MKVENEWKKEINEILIKKRGIERDGECQFLSVLFTVDPTSYAAQGGRVVWDYGSELLPCCCGRVDASS